MMTTVCPENQRLQQFLDGRLPENHRGALEDHLRQCEYCRQLAKIPLSRQSIPFGQYLNTPPPASSSSSEDQETLELPGQTPCPAPDNSTTAGGSASLDSLQPGDRLDRYEIIDILGRGGMGIVFRARDTVLGRTVAIKVLGPSLADSLTARRRFIREGQTAGAVKDVHVVTVYGVEGHEHSPYLVLEYVEGRSLEDLLTQSAPLQVNAVIDLGTQIALGLEAAHQKGLIHRDIKPSNILIEKGTGRVAITDFGLARAVDDVSLSREGEVCGTPHYMSPEQVAGLAIDHRSDLFSLGSVLYYMCTGELPFSANNAMAVLHRVLEDQPRPVQKCIRSVPTWLAKVIAALHAKDPGQRIQSASEVVAVLNSRQSPGPIPQPLWGPVLAPVAEQAERAGRTLAFGSVLFVVFLLTLPAMYFLTVPANEPHHARDEAQIRKPKSVDPATETQGKKKTTLELKPGPAELQPGNQVRAATPRSNSRPGQPSEGKKQAPAEMVKGPVMLLINDPSSMAYHQEEGLRVRAEGSSRSVLLQQGWNDLPVGDYTVEQGKGYSRVRISPKRFIVTSETPSIVQITCPASAVSPPEEPKGVGRNPPPPPFGPRRPPPRR